MPQGPLLNGRTYNQAFIPELICTFKYQTIGTLLSALSKNPKEQCQQYLGYCIYIYVCVYSPEAKKKKKVDRNDNI